MIFKGEQINPQDTIDTPTVVKWGKLEAGTFGGCYHVHMSVTDPELATKMWKKMKKMVAKYDAKHFEATTKEEVTEE